MPIYGQRQAGDVSIPTVRVITLEASSAEIIAVGEKDVVITCPISGTINRWRINAYPATSAVISVWKIKDARPTVANIITGSAKPTVVSDEGATSTTLTDWIVSVEEGDRFVMSVDSNTAAKFLSVQLEMV